MQLVVSIQEYMQTKLGLRTGIVVNALLILFFLITVYQIILLFKIEKAEAIPFTPLKKIEIPEMATWHLFGFDQSNMSELEGLPAANLDLRLTGIFIATPAEESYVIIAQNDKEQIYKIGDVIANQSKIYQILPDHIILQDHDHLSSLSLSTKPLVFDELPKPLQN